MTNHKTTGLLDAVEEHSTDLRIGYSARLWQRFASRLSLAKATQCICTQLWATCRPVPTRPNWQRNNLATRPKLLDHDNTLWSIRIAVRTIVGQDGSHGCAMPGLNLGDTDGLGAGSHHRQLRRPVGRTAHLVLGPIIEVTGIVLFQQLAGRLNECHIKGANKRRMLDNLSKRR